MAIEVLFTLLEHGKFAELVAGMPESQCQGQILLKDAQPTRDNCQVWVKLQCKGCNAIISLKGHWHFHEMMTPSVPHRVRGVSRDIPPWGPDQAPNPETN